MASAGVNVLRYTALAVGIVYGISHQRSISSAAKSRQVNHEYERRNELINKAKAEYSKKTAPPESKTASGGVITDPQDPHFDLEAFLKQAAAES